jgi:hypothetical protein
MDTAPIFCVATVLRLIEGHSIPSKIAESQIGARVPLFVFGELEDVCDWLGPSHYIVRTGFAGMGQARMYARMALVQSRRVSGRKFEGDVYSPGQPTE